MTISISSATQLMPMGDRVVIRPTKAEETTRSGIVLPDTAKERPQKGVVIAVGPGRYLSSGKRLEMEVEAGDEVIFSKYAGTEITMEDEEVLILGVGDILAKIS